MERPRGDVAAATLAATVAAPCPHRHQKIAPDVRACRRLYGRAMIGVRDTPDRDESSRATRVHLRCRLARRVGSDRRGHRSRRRSGRLVDHPACSRRHHLAHHGHRARVEWSELSVGTDAAARHPSVLVRDAVPSIAGNRRAGRHARRPARWTRTAGRSMDRRRVCSAAGGLRAGWVSGLTQPRRTAARRDAAAAAGRIRRTPHRAESPTCTSDRTRRRVTSIVWS